MTKDFSKIDRLVADLEAGLSVDSLLAEINADEDLRWNWGQEHFVDCDFFFVVHESSIFMTDDDIEDYFDPEYLLLLRDAQVTDFVTSQLERCIDSGNSSAIHFCEISNSAVSAVGEFFVGETRVIFHSIGAHSKRNGSPKC